MKKQLAAIGLAVALGPVEFGSRPTATETECAIVRTEARPSGYGFDHVIYVRNGCSVTIDCKVSSDLDRRPRHRLVVPPSQEKGVVTRTNSQRRTFAPRVSCVQRARVA